jgi:hypothetical protein
MGMSLKGRRASPEANESAMFTGVRTDYSDAYLFWSRVGEEHDGRLAIGKDKSKCMRDRA